MLGRHRAPSSGELRALLSWGGLRALVSGPGVGQVQSWLGKHSHGKVRVRWVNLELSLCRSEEAVQGVSVGLFSLQFMCAFGGQCGADKVSGGCVRAVGDSYQVRADLQAV